MSPGRDWAEEGDGEVRTKLGIPADGKGGDQKRVKRSHSCKLAEGHKRGM